MAKHFAALIDAFRDDHVQLGRGFHDLSVALRAHDVAAAKKAAEALEFQAGAHIAFEELDFYPVLADLLGEEIVRRFEDEHRHGFEAVRSVLAHAPDKEFEETPRLHLVRQSEQMEIHIAECGELFGAIGRIPPAQQETLLSRLQEWRRRRPKWSDLVEDPSSQTRLALDTERRTPARRP